MQGCLVQVGNGIDLEAVGLQFEPYRRRPCGVTWDSSRTVVVIKLRRTSALRPAVLYAKYAESLSLYIAYFAFICTPDFADERHRTGCRLSPVRLGTYLQVTAGCVCMMVAHLWCDLSRCSVFPNSRGY